MADVKNVTAPFTVIATTASRVKDLTIKNGQIIFVQDKGRIAFDFKDKRVFYNQITELNTEYERTTLDSPSYGYYFVIETACLWRYDNEWVQISGQPEEVVFIGVELPELGQANKIYIDKDDREISVWDDETGKYIVISKYTEEVSEEDIESLFD